MHPRNSLKTIHSFKYLLSLLLGLIVLCVQANASFVNCPDSLPPYFMPEAADLAEACGGGNDQVRLDNWILDKGGAIPLDSCNAVLWVDFDYIASDGSGGNHLSFDSLHLYPRVPQGDCSWSVQLFFRAADSLGNQSLSDAFFSLSDSESPLLLGAPNDRVVSCDAIPDPPLLYIDITAVDNCDSSVTITFSQSSNQTNTSACSDYTYIINRSWTATDDCNNTTVETQEIRVMDSDPPSFTPPADMTVSCNQGILPAVTGTVSNVIDQCDPDPDTLYSDVFSAGNCVNNYTITRIWRVRDACNNVSAARLQTITVRDTLSPVFTRPATDGTHTCSDSAAAELAFRNWMTSRGGAVALDDCSPGSEMRWYAAVPGSYLLSDSLSIVHPGSLEEANCPSAVSGSFRSESVDFIVYDECGNAAVTSATFRVLDTLPPVFDWCPGDSSIANVSGGCTADYDLIPPVARDECEDSDYIILEYAINDGPRSSWSSSASVTEIFPVGMNEIRYYATDCAGNERFCSFLLEVRDVDPPLLRCPADTLLYLDPADDCQTGVSLPLPFVEEATDNCSFSVFTQTQPGSAAASLLRFSYDSLYQDYMADDKDFTFVGTAANAVGGGVNLLVILAADGEDAEEYFSILDEDGNLLGTTQTGQLNVNLLPGDCNANPVRTPYISAYFQLPAPQFNAWAADGSVQFTAVHHNNFSNPAPGQGDEGINPLCTPFPSGTPGGTADGSSFMTMRLSYEQNTPAYFVSGATSVPLTTMVPPRIAPVVSFLPGTSFVTYVVADESGNRDSCEFVVEVIDSVAPLPVCRPDTVFVNPSGLLPAYITATDLDGGSDDNCTVDSLSIDRDSFDCSLAGNVIAVELTAVDPSGNRASCQSLVTVLAQPPDPGYSIGLCGNDTLYLFANPPAAPPGFDYTYSWTGPQSFSSSLANPIIPDATSANSGFYVLEISGQGGCSAVDSVEVLINPIPDIPDIQANRTDLCENDQLVLSTQQYAGSTVFYYWYSGSSPGGTIIDTTLIPSLTLPPPLSDGSYYVAVEVDGCLSGASPQLTTNITVAPDAVTDRPFIDICSGQEIVLGTPVTGPGYTYSWTGPNGYVSTDQNPPPFTVGSPSGGGVYRLIITANGCPSEVAETVVLVRPRPSRPVLSSGGLGCEGGMLTLTASPAGGDLYTWIAPDSSTQITTANTLSLINATTGDAGQWRVAISENGCPSQPSEPVTIFIEPLPVVTASNNGPGCEGGLVELSASPVPGADYQWTGPGGFSAQGPTVVSAAIAGTYTVVVTSSLNCSSQATTVVSVNELPKITALSSTAAACVDGSVPVRLIPTLFPPDDGSYTYSWTGPNAFTATDSIPVLPTGTSADNGRYRVRVTNGTGCTSLPDSILLQLQDIPDRPPIFGPSTVCEGQGFQLTTSAYSGGMVHYEWRTPLGDFLTSLPQLEINAAGSANGGGYSLVVRVDGCESIPSDTLLIEINSGLPLPEIRSNSPVCEGEAIELLTDSIPGATYEWTSPGSRNLNGYRPVILNALPEDGGMYSVQIQLNGCTSPVSLPVNVVVKEKPDPPALLNNGPVCIDEPGEVLLLSINPQTVVPGASYTWFLSASGQQIGGPSTATQLALNNLSGFGAGLVNFYAIATLNGCRSANSVATSVVMDAIPAFTAFAGADSAYCDPATIRMDAVMPPTGTGEWSQIAGPPVVILDSSRADSPLSGLPADTTIRLLWTLSEGVCRDYSSDEVTITINTAAQQADAGADTSICNLRELVLTAAAAAGLNQGIWTQTTLQEAGGVQIGSPENAMTNVTGLQPPGTYFFTWNLYNEGCDTFSTDEVAVMVIEDNEPADAGGDLLECGFGNLFLMAAPPENGTGSWSTPHSELRFADPNDPATEVEGLSSGFYTFIWTLDRGGCGTVADTIEVEYELAPRGVGDEISVPFARRAEFDVLINDLLPAEGAFVVLDTPPLHGNLRNGGGGLFTYDPDPLFAGIDSFRYLVCSRICPEVCSLVTVILKVGGTEECFAPTIITPNGDQFNDAFVVPCLATDQFPNNILRVYNQWGDQVYEASPYRNDWEGTYNGDELPSGSYYYTIEFGNGRAPLSNFLVIER